jgi:hypothetical protein
MVLDLTSLRKAVVSLQSSIRTVAGQKSAMDKDPLLADLLRAGDLYKARFRARGFGVWFTSVGQGQGIF